MKKYLIILGLLFFCKPFYGQNIQELILKRQAVYESYLLLKKEYGTPDKKLVLPNNHKNFDEVEILKKDTIKLKSIEDQYISIQKRIYGADNRRNITDEEGVYALTKAKKNELSSAVVAIIPFSNLDTTNKLKYKITASRLKDTQRNGCTTTLCSDIAFGDQLSFVKGSGFILTNKRVLTADHLFNNDYIDKYCVVINYFTDLTEIDPKNVFRIKRVIQKADKDFRKDFKIFEVDRDFPLINKPLKINGDLTIAEPDNVFMIGFPSGLPMKIADSAQVFGLHKEYFFANLDAFSGNSGSPVFHKSGSLEGILVDGGQDYTNSGLSCCTLDSYSKEIENGQKTETILRLQFILQTPSYLK